ncbi:hypothetical protein [Microbacterium luticocti]|uniref:hypothetical protein n=1 Tax=Microbacterium luticocti TaxID=451764 RepID=UPI0012EB6E15|nr:hypothetical protein [Microbacterium luticocti]
MPRAARRVTASLCHPGHVAVPPKRLFERIVFLVHGVVTLAAAVVLVVFPAAIPATVGIRFATDAVVLLPYLLGATELAIALISLGAVRIADRRAVRLIAFAFALLHAVTAALEIVYLAAEGMSVVLVVNLAVRIVVTGVFVVIWWNRRPVGTAA